MVDETPIFDEYISLVDLHGANSKEATQFRMRHPEMSNLFASVNELVSAGRFARMSRAVGLACWVGAFVCVAAIGWVGIQRGGQLAHTQELLADANTHLRTADRDVENLKGEYASVQQARDKANVELAALKKENAFGDLTTKLNDEKSTREATQSQLASAEAAVRQRGAELGKAQTDVAELQAKLLSSERLRTDADRAAASARQELAAVLQMDRLAGSLSPVSDLAFSLDGRLVAAADWDGELEVFDVQSGKSVGRDRIIKNDVRLLCVGFARHNDSQAMVAATTKGGTVSTWALGAMGDIHTIRGPWGPIFSAAIAPGGGLIALGGRDKTVFLVDSTSGKIAGRLKLAASSTSSPASAASTSAPSSVGAAKK